LEKFEMKKTLVAVAAMAVVTGAMAEVTISGHLDQALTSYTGVESTSTSTSVTTYSYTGLMSVMAPSFITFSGTEDIGNGLKANFKIENGLGMNSTNLLASNTAGWNATSSANREAWAGISGDFGDVKVGTQYTPAFWGALTLDPSALNNGPGFLALNVLNSNGALANSQAVTYTSPSISGITFSAQSYSGGGNSAAASTNSGNGFGYSLTYNSGPLYATFAYNSDAVSTATTLTATAHGLYGPTTSYTGLHDHTYAAVAAGDSTVVTLSGLSYDFGSAKVAYMNTQATLNSDTATVNTVGITVPMGAFSLGYSYNTGSLTGVGSSGLTVNSTGHQAVLNYNLSKRTSAYVAYNQSLTSSSYKDSVTVTAIGIAHSF